MTYYVEPFLRRKKQPSLVRYWILLGVCVAILAATIWVNWDALPHAHAAERTYTAVIRDGHTLTPKEYCKTV